MFWLLLPFWLLSSRLQLTLAYPGATGHNQTPTPPGGDGYAGNSSPDANQSSGQYGAPPAHCYTDNHSNAPGNLSDMFANNCAHQWGINYNCWTVDFVKLPDDGSPPKKGVQCSDIGGDVKNLLKQCPMGGVLEHWVDTDHYGATVVKNLACPNTPPAPEALGPSYQNYNTTQNPPVPTPSHVY